jgi:hypothetical protein
LYTDTVITLAKAEGPIFGTGTKKVDAVVMGVISEEEGKVEKTAKYEIPAMRTGAETASGYWEGNPW